jgi:hypothetical protein
MLYWELGRAILVRQVAGTWGTGNLEQVSYDLGAPSSTAD